MESTKSNSVLDFLFIFETGSLWLSRTMPFRLELLCPGYVIPLTPLPYPKGNIMSGSLRFLNSISEPLQLTLDIHFISVKYTVLLLRSFWII